MTKTDQTKLYTVTSEQGTFILTCSLFTLGHILNCHQDALHRVLRETKDGGSCHLFSNRQKWGIPHQSALVREA
jgi:hypothetical protein